MRNLEILAQLKAQDISQDTGGAVEGKSFENLRLFIAYDTVASVRLYPPGTKPDYSDKSTYFPPIPTSMSKENWERGLRMTYDFAFTEDTLEEIGKRNGNLSRERVRQIIRRTVINLHASAGQAAWDRFPFDSFDFGKPYTITSRQKMSELHGGTSLNIARMIDQGATIDDIKKEYTAGQRSNARITLKSWGGTQLERELNPILPQFEGLRRPDATDEQIQTLLDKITNTGRHQVLKQAGLIIAQSTVARKTGLYISGDQVNFVSESLAKEKLPQAKFPHKIKDENGQGKIAYYHIIAAIHEQRATDILQKDRNLDDLRINPVTQIAGPKAERLPNTTQLASEEYESLGNLIGEIRGSRWSGKGKGGIKIADIIQGSTIEIYSNSAETLFRKDREAQLRLFLESRLRELGMI